VWRRRCSGAGPRFRAYTVCCLQCAKILLCRQGTAMISQSKSFVGPPRDPRSICWTHARTLQQGRLESCHTRPHSRSLCDCARFDTPQGCVHSRAVRSASGMRLSFTLTVDGSVVHAHLTHHISVTCGLCDDCEHCSLPLATRTTVYSRP
jgi:hypothetical protein